jgi:hypothetical protein
MKNSFASDFIMRAMRGFFGAGAADGDSFWPHPTMRKAANKTVMIAAAKGRIVFIVSFLQMDGSLIVSFFRSDRPDESDESDRSTSHREVFVAFAFFVVEFCTFLAST